MISHGSPAQISDACQRPPVIWFFSSPIVVILYLRRSASAEILHGGEKEDPRGDWPHHLLALLYQKREKEAGGFVELLKCDVTSMASQRFTGSSWSFGFEHELMTRVLEDCGPSGTNIHDVIRGGGACC